MRLELGTGVVSTNPRDTIADVGGYAEGRCGVARGAFASAAVERGAEAPYRRRESLKVLLQVPMDVPVLPRGHNLACLLARGRREQRAQSMLTVGASHQLGVVLDRSIRHHDEPGLAVVENLGAVAALASVVRRDEHIDTLEEVIAPPRRLNAPVRRGT